MLRRKKVIYALVEAAHYGTAYFADEGKDLVNGLTMHGKTLTIESKYTDNRIVTTVKKNDSGETVLAADYRQKTIGDVSFPYYILKKLNVAVYRPGDWENRLLSVKESALLQRDRNIKYAYDNHYDF